MYHGFVKIYREYAPSASGPVSFTLASEVIFFYFQIRTNAINPTAVDTDMGKKVTSNPVVREMVLGKIPMNRFPGKNPVLIPVLSNSSHVH